MTFETGACVLRENALKSQYQNFSEAMFAFSDWIYHSQ